MSLDPRDRLRHARARKSAEHGDADHRRRRASRCPKAPRSCARRWRPASQIPKLCATDMLEAFGSCRLCLVEIEGRAGTPASCTTPVAPGMVVHTQTERLDAAAQGRDGALHLRPSARLPDLRGQRRLRAAGHGRRGRPARGALRLRRREPPRNPQADATSPTPISPSIPSKCIVCSRCVRACEEVQGTFALTIAGRGFDSEVSPGMDEPFLDSECVSCGACVQACPTATLHGEDP